METFSQGQQTSLEEQDQLRQSVKKHKRNVDLDNENGDES